MFLEWDEAKRLANLEKHGLDFGDADEVFDGQHVIITGRTVGGEERQIAVGRIGGEYVALVFTERGDAIRVISLRRARRGERRRHQALYG